MNDIACVPTISADYFQIAQQDRMAYLNRWEQYPYTETIRHNRRLARRPLTRLAERLAVAVMLTMATAFAACLLTF